MGAVGDFGERVRAGAEMVVAVGEIDLGADQADGKLVLHLPPALADARVENGRLDPGIGTDQQHRACILDAADGGIKDVAGAAKGRIELGAVLPAIDVRRSEPFREQFQREHLLGTGKIAGDRAKA